MHPSLHICSEINSFGSEAGDKQRMRYETSGAGQRSWLLHALSSLYHGAPALQATKLGMSRANGPLFTPLIAVCFLTPGANAPLLFFSQGQLLICSCEWPEQAAFGLDSKLKRGSLASGQASSTQGWCGFCSLDC